MRGRSVDCELRFLCRGSRGLCFYRVAQSQRGTLKKRRAFPLPLKHATPNPPHFSHLSAPSFPLYFHVCHFTYHSDPVLVGILIRIHPNGLLNKWVSIKLRTQNQILLWQIILQPCGRNDTKRFGCTPKYFSFSMLKGRSFGSFSVSTREEIYSFESLPTTLRQLLHLGPIYRLVPF